MAGSPLPNMTFDAPSRAPRAARALAARRAAARRGGGDGASRRLRDLLRNEVVSGVYPDGLLPSEGELMLAHETSRATVREALALLRAEGLVERVQGIGTFSVCETRAVLPMEESHGIFGDQPVIRRLRPTVLDRSVIAAPPAVARKLELPVGEPVLRLEYMGYFDGEPLCIATNYVAFPEAAAIQDAPFERDFYTLLDAAGVALGETEWMLSATNADAIVAELLDVAPGSALMLAEELIWDEGGRVYDFAVCYVRTDRFAYRSSAGGYGPRDRSETIVDVGADQPAALR